jgi:tRNA A-37 threonylcarbamoyl transferase component Bud32
MALGGSEQCLGADVLTRQTLGTLPRRRIHEGRNRTKAVVDLVEIAGRAIVVKDLLPRPWPIRRFLGPWQLDREERAYRALAGVPGTPAFLGRLDRQAIALEYVPGRTLASVRPGELKAEFFDRLDGLLAAIHARGVAHGDLHRHDVLAGPGDEPCLVDFSTSVTLSPVSGRMARLLFRQLCRADVRSAVKLRRRLLPGSGAAVPERPVLYRLGRWAKRTLDMARRRR